MIHGVERKVKEWVGSPEATSAYEEKRGNDEK